MTSHIRPKVRKAAKPKGTVPPNKTRDEAAVEDVRVKMDQWMGLGEPKKKEGGPPVKEISILFNENSTIQVKPDAATQKGTTEGSSAMSESEATMSGQTRERTTNDDIPNTDNPNETETTNSKTSSKTKKNLKSILKTPKYTTGQIPIVNDTILDETNNEGESPLALKKKKKPSVFKQSCIQERDPTVQPAQPQFNPPSSHTAAGGAAMAVEGYEPVMDHNKRIGGKNNNKNSTKKPPQKEQDPRKEADHNNNSQEEKEETKGEEGEPLVFNSIADLMEAAGTLPAQDGSVPPQVVEADLAFSCMTKEDFQRELILQGMEQQEQQMEQQQQSAREGSGKKKVEWNAPDDAPTRDNHHLLDDDHEGYYTGSDPVNDDEDNDYDSQEGEEGGGGLFDLMGYDDDDESEEERPVFKPRAFRLLWECLSPLITHESCVYLKRVQKIHETGSGANPMPTAPMYDLEASRSNGFMAMLRMYMSRCLGELGQPTEMKRTAEQRLQGLLYTFNFSRPAAKLDTKQWKALTCILLEVVLFLDQSNENNPAGPQLPASAGTAEMTLEEYQYLVKNTISTFDIPDPVI